MSLDLPALGRLAARVGFAAAGSLLGTCSISQPSAEAAYDVASDSHSPMPTPIEDIPFFAYAKKNPQADEEDSHSRRVLIKAEDLPTGTVLSQQDTFNDGAQDWEIAEASVDPTGALWILDLKR